MESLFLMRTERDTVNKIDGEIMSDALGSQEQRNASSIRVYYLLLSDSRVPTCVF